MRMGVTRSGVNAWEMGISKPSLDNLITLSRIFHTTTDYLLGIENEDIIIINNFTMEEKGTGDTPGSLYRKYAEYGYRPKKIRDLRLLFF